MRCRSHLLIIEGRPGTRMPRMGESKPTSRPL
jgi:hypothetical protein